MSWLEIIAVAVLLLGIGAGGYLVAQRPAFWWGLGAVAFRAALPFLVQPMTPEQEKAFQACVRRGGEWDSFRKRCKS